MGKALLLVIDPGSIFGMLTVIKFCYDRNQMKWLCKCDCGNATRVTVSSLRRGQQSCGCLQGRPYSSKNLRETMSLGDKADKLFPIEHDQGGERRNARSRKGSGRV